MTEGSDLKSLNPVALLLVVLVALVGCGEKKNSPSGPEVKVTSDPPAKVETPTASAGEILHNPRLATEKAPDSFRVSFDTTKGNFTLKCVRAWSPLGVDRFYNLVKIGYFKNVAFFRAVRGFMVQFGIHPDPKINEIWMLDRSGAANINDDHPEHPQSNKPGYLSFAKTGQPNSRSVQLFINTGNNARLDAQGFTPIGKVEGTGLSVVKSLYSGYGEATTRKQEQIARLGDRYLSENFPQLDYIKSITILE